MLFDLTRISGERVSQVDELKVAGRIWLRSTDLLLIGGGAVVGVMIAQSIRMLTVSWIPYLLIPVCACVSYVLFSRKRSVAGEVHARRFDRWRDKRRALDGEFILPGSSRAFSPNGYRLIMQHAHPVYAPRSYS
ncbi:hypothetical protein [Bombiscardovia coagulans]|uniref:Uncharacterized protein n=1 Tax=Bombiscardovia coagulans TaxID=686666 RepID=A0A261ESL1_9BIFI|nr:hypothetical protein [Bombiscardovia coagulans]OZG49847.1 hypothetical protein BOCO_0364 [Bombiscardovia coagulans]